MPNDVADVPHILDTPPPFHRKIVEYGERPYWTRDGKSLVFMEKNYGDACIVDLDTLEVRPLTAHLGDHHSFLRVLVLSNGDYLLIGPPEFKDRHTSRHIDSELWVLDQSLTKPPKRLGRRIFEGCGVSTLTPKITYSMNGHQDPALDSPEVFECHVTDIVYGPDGPELGDDQVFYRVRGRAPEPQDFRNDDTEVIFAEYHQGVQQSGAPEPYCSVRGFNLETKEFRTYIQENRAHNEPEGIFGDGEHICLESGGDVVGGFPPRSLWKLKLDGSFRRANMTNMPVTSRWRTTNSNVSPDGKWLAYMVTRVGDEPGYGRGIGLLDLEAWAASGGEQWETPAERAVGNFPIYDYPSPEDEVHLAPVVR